MSTKSIRAADIPSGKLAGVDKYAVGTNGAYFAVSRRCRHLGADLAEGSVDAEGCVVCPWHGARYDVADGRMVSGPGGIFARIPGLGATFKLFTKVLPLRRRQVVERNGELTLGRELR